MAAPGIRECSLLEASQRKLQKHLFPGDRAAAPPDPNAPFDEQAAGHRKDLPPPPESSPPWPYSVWNAGGTEYVGHENMYYGALMDAIYCRAPFVRPP
jgi:hypothetical protein